MRNPALKSSGCFAAAALKRGAAGVSICLALAAISGAAFAQCVNTKIEDPIPGLIPASSTQVKLATIASGLISPVGGAVAPGVPNRIFVLDQIGKIWAIDVYGPRRGEVNLFLDVSTRMVPVGLFKPLNYDSVGCLAWRSIPTSRSNALYPGGAFPGRPTTGAPST
jgi:hypothetical protein